MHLTGSFFFFFLKTPLLEMEPISKVDWNESNYGITLRG